MALYDAIERARSEHQIFFLMTAYIENLRYSHHATVLPAHVTVLPVRDMDDLKTRSDVLDVLSAVYFQDPVSGSGVIREASALFRAAWQRLRDLREPDTGDGGLQSTPRCCA